MEKLRVSVRGYRRRGYVRKGTYVDPAYVDPHTKMVPDKGEKGRTPKSRRWYEYSGKHLHGWTKDQSTTDRRRRASIGRDDLSSGRALQQLSNLTTDIETKRTAKEDADYFFRKIRKR